MNQPHYAIRAGTNADWPALGQAVAQIQDFEHEIVGFPVLPKGDIGEDYLIDLLQRLSGEDGVFLLAEAKGEIIGALAGYAHRSGDRLVAPEFDRSAYISDLFVRSEWRRQGVGTALVRAFEQAMRDNGLQWMTVCVKSKNRAAHQAYRSCGFDDYETILAKPLS